MSESPLKRFSRYALQPGLLAIALGGILFSAQSVFNWKVGTALGVGSALLLFYLLFHSKELLANWRTRSTQYGINTAATVLVLFGILGVINFLGARHHRRFDLTTNKLFSISEQTEGILKNLKSDIRLVYFDQQESQQTKDLAREFMSESPRIHYEFLDVQKHLQRARDFKVKSVPMVVVVPENNPNLKHMVDNATEENLTHAIIKLTHQKQRTIYFTENHGEAPLAGTEGDGLSRAKKALEDQGYETKTISLAQSKSVPEDCSVLVIAGAKYAFLQPEIEAIGHYVDAGGKLLALMDPDTQWGMEKELAKWKIQVGNDTVVDASGLGQLLGLGPAAPMVMDYENQPIVKDFGRTMTIFPLARSVRVSNADSDFFAGSLLKTSGDSWGETNLKERPLKFDKGQDLEGPVSLAVVSTKSVAGSSDKPARSKEARVEVIGNSRFSTNGYFSLQRNGDLFLNSVSWLAEDEDLVAIRPKNPENRRVEFSASTARLLFWLIIVILPAAALVSGAFVWSQRRK